jgi:hypothetical protein
MAETSGSYGKVGSVFGAQRALERLTGEWAKVPAGIGGQLIRIVLTLAALALQLTQAVAQDWTPFGIKRFGFIVDVPPGFVYTRSLRENHQEGAAFQNADGDAIVVWGIALPIRDFPKNVEALIAQQQEDEGLGVTYKRITPKWAAYSGFKDRLIRYVKAITICEDRAAFFLIDYDRHAKRNYDPVVAQMEKSLKREGC